MATLTLELPPQKAQTTFNLRRWAEVLADPELARFEGRVETDRHGHVLRSWRSTPMLERKSSGRVPSPGR